MFDWDYDLFDNTVHVFDLTGAEIGAIGNEPDVQSLTASPDGKRIYAGLGSAKAVSVIDTGTLTEVARYDASALGAPIQVAEAGNRLFVGGMQNPAIQPLFQIGVVDLSAPSGSSIPALVETGNDGSLVAAESSPGWTRSMPPAAAGRSATAGFFTTATPVGRRCPSSSESI